MLAMNGQVSIYHYYYGYHYSGYHNYYYYYYYYYYKNCIKVIVTLSWHVQLLVLLRQDS